MYSFYVYIACGGMEIWFCHFEKKYLYEEPNYPNLLLLCLKCHFYNFSDYSLSQAFGQYLTHAYGESAIQQLKGKICKIFSSIQYWFSLAKIHRNENILLIENYNGEYLHLISIRKSLGILLTIFQRCHLGLLKYKTDKHYIFSHVLKLNALEGAFQKEILKNVHTFQWKSFEPLGIYKYRIIKQNVNPLYPRTVNRFASRYESSIFWTRI